MTLTAKEPKLIVFTGAGLSADSGIPTFRADTGVWDEYDINVVANGLTWRNNRETIRKFYNARRENLATAEPNDAHKVIAKWSNLYNTTILTQNIDNLLERAGCSNVIHLHGELTKMTCVACGNIWDVNYNQIQKDDRCGKCNSLKGVRPYIVFFHEAAPNYVKMHAAFKNLRKEDCVVIIGTSGEVIHIDSYIHDSPCTKILNNLESRQNVNEAYYNHVLFGRASEMSSKLDEIVEQHFNNLNGNLNA